MVINQPLITNILSGNFSVIKMRLSSVVPFFFLVSRIKITSAFLFANVTDVEYSAKLFDYLLNSTDYDSRMRPIPRGVNEPVEVCAPH